MINAVAGQRHRSYDVRMERQNINWSKGYQEVQVITFTADNGPLQKLEPLIFALGQECVGFSELLQYALMRSHHNWKCMSSFCCTWSSPETGQFIGGDEYLDLRHLLGTGSPTDSSSTFFSLSRHIFLEHSPNNVQSVDAQLGDTCETCICLPI
uniref:Uncharacterized protein n=1 Tax=Parascaris univalens TaxID=6257 RepID=A0A915C0D7_PARUN